MFEAKQIEYGHKERYGDFYRTWNIITDLPREAVVRRCLAELAKRDMPERTEWLKNIRKGLENIRKGGERDDVDDYYFRGSYTLTAQGEGETITGYVFEVREPYAD